MYMPETIYNDSKASRTQLLQQRVTLREANKTDETFLVEVYASTRVEEFSMLGWSEPQLRDFLKMQFDLQMKAYEMQFLGAAISIIELDGNAIGRLIVYRREMETRLVDIALLPLFRNQGIGTFLMAQLQRQAVEENKPVVLRVLRSNLKAIRLYEKCGFTATESNQTHLTMTWGAGQK